MNTLVFHPEAAAPLAVHCVDFKWLMAREGHRIDAERLQADAEYATQCLALARASTNPLLHLIAQRLVEARHVGAAPCCTTEPH